jgi:spore germination cell wall hydrolase CwlJ-like protein
MNKILTILVALIALTVMAPGHAEDKINRDLTCLAQNIYYEAGNEVEEGKVAVGLVTINRSNSGRYPSTICGVVNQKTAISKSRTVTEDRVQYDAVGRKRIVTDQRQVFTTRTVCQFSWRCENVTKIKYNSPRWNSSLEVAQNLLAGGYEEFRDKYRDAEYFHEVHIRPGWARQKHRINRIGGHIFYAERAPESVELTIAQQ